MTLDYFWEENDELIIKNNYKNILRIDNDLYDDLNNIEEKRKELISSSLIILENNPDLIVSDIGKTFLNTIVFPSLTL